MRGVSPLCFSLFTVFSDNKYAIGSKIYRPNLQNEEDTLRHYDYIADFTQMEQFPTEVRKYFLRPVGQHILPNQTTTLVFPAFVCKNENDIGKIELIKEVLLSILQTGRYDIYERFLTNIWLQHVVETDHGFRILWPPAHERFFSSTIDNPEILFLVQLIRSRMEIQFFSIGTIQDSLLKISRLMEWPEQDEMKKYAIERLQTGNEDCHPVSKRFVNTTSVFKETDEQHADSYIRVWDTENTYRRVEEPDLHFFSNYIVYVTISENGSFVPAICISPVHFADIGSKHAHLLIRDLPDKYYYLFSGELAREASSKYVIFNLNSGMFYHKQLEPNRKPNLSIFDLTSDESGTLQSYFCSEVLNWTLLAQKILSSLLSEPVIFVRNLRPYLKLTEERLGSYCKIDGFSLKEYTSMKQCTSGGFGRSKCSQYQK